MAGGLLHAAGLDELIATSWEGYEALVVELSEDEAARDAIKARMFEMRDEWKNAPLRFVRSLEQALFQLVGDRSTQKPQTGRGTLKFPAR
jgi:predicted O-linked N-acetylglucosamine transferase (SPINDLY family)